jgi:2-aminoadipate transaminase
MTEPYDPLASVQAAGPPGTISFIYGLPDPATFPAEELRLAANRVLRGRPELALQYGPEQGYGPLIDFLRRRLEREEGLAVGRPQIMLTAGSSQVLDHICTLFTRPGDVVLVEAPTYHETLLLFRDHGLIPLQIPTDADGLLVDALAERLAVLSRDGRRVRFLYTIPNYQTPSGITLAADRRPAVLELAKRYDLLVLEDDVYRELAYGQEPPPSLFSLEREASGRRVLRIGSFSKILAPGLRLGWLLAAPDLISRLCNSGLRSMGGGASPLIANTLAEYCGQGRLEPHIDRLREVYRGRRDLALGALEAHMPAGVRWTRPGGGFFAWLSLAPSHRAVDVVAQARAKGVWLLAGDPFFAEEPTGQHLRLAYSFVPPDKIEAGIRILGSMLGSPVRESARGQSAGETG